MINKFTIIRDTRENVKHGWYFPSNSVCNGTIVDTVNIGDYTVQGLENYVAIERKKSIDEFAHNCIEKRWKSCMERMATVKHKYIIFEFPWYDVDHYPHSSKAPIKVKSKLRVPSKYIWKIIKIARNEHNIHIIAAKNPIMAERLAYRILSKAYELKT